MEDRKTGPTTNTKKAELSQSEDSSVRSADGLLVLDQRRHILYRADIYVGSTKKIERLVLAYDGKTIAWKTTQIPRALERLILEVCENGFDAYRRGDKKGKVDGRPLKLSITNRWRVTLWNGGDVLPIVKHSSGKGYYPQVALFTLNTSDNFSQSALTGEAEKKTKREFVVKGRNGLGSKVPSILSDESEATCGDSKKQITIRSSHNMETVEVLSIVPTKESFVSFSYSPDKSRFDGYVEYDDTALEMIRAHVLCFSYCNGRSVVFNVDGQEESFPAITIYEFVSKLFPTYEYVPVVGYLWEEGQKYSISRNKKGYMELPERGEMPTLEFAILVTPHEGKAVSFVNGSLTIDNGSHVEAVYKAIRDYVVRKGSGLNITYIRKHVSLVVSCNILEDPQMESNAKTRLVSPEFTVTLTQRMKAEIDALPLAKILEEEAKHKVEMSALAPIKKRIGSVNIEKLQDAIYASMPHSKRDGKPVIIYLVEGDSAMNTAVRYIENDQYHCGVFPLRGKPIGAVGRSLDELLKNEEVAAICEILGLDPRLSYGDDLREIPTRRYDMIRIMTDEDDDAIHIRVLLAKLFPSLFSDIPRWDGALQIVETPLMSVPLPKELLVFYTTQGYDAWAEKNPGLAKKYPPKYYKGLGTFNKDEVQYCFEHNLFYNVTLVYDEHYRDSFSFLMDKERRPEKKEWVANYDHKPLPQLIGKITVSELIKDHMPRYCYASIVRGIPGIDGFKQASRKAMSASLIHWNGGINTHIMPVDAMAGLIKQTMAYHPKLDTMYDTIARMTCDYPGSNNIPLLVADGMFRDRVSEKDGAARYIKTGPPPGLWPLLFPPTFRKITPRVFYESEAEYEQIVSCVPLILMNGSKGVAEAWANEILPCNPRAVIDMTRVLIKGTYDPKKRYLVPWFRNYKGTVMMVPTTELSKRDKELKKRRYVATTSPEDEWTQEDAQPVDGDDSAVYSVVITGNYQVESSGKVVVTEILPSETVPSYKRCLTEMTKPPLDSEGKPLLDANKNPVAPAIVSYIPLSKRDRVTKCDIIRFEIEGMKNPNIYSLNLRETKKMSNMNIVIGTKVRHFDSHDAIAVAWYENTLPYYEKRYQYELDQLEQQAIKSVDQAAFIELVVAKKIDLRGKTRSVVIEELKKHSIDYEKVRKLNIESQTTEEAKKLLLEHRALLDAIETMKKRAAKDLWLEDLDKLSAYLDENY